MKKFSLILSVFLITALFVDCKKKKLSEEEEVEISFDKPGMLSNYSANVIIPNLQFAKTTLDSFALAYNDFIQNKNIANLILARQKFIRAYETYEYISIFEFGPSENEMVRSNFNTYPTDTAQIRSNISAGVYDLNIASNISAKGFPSIDFLLFGKNSSDANIVALFETDVNAAKRVAYVSNCLSEMQAKLNAIILNWSNSYKNTFGSSTGSEIGSSLGMLVNQLNFEIDLLTICKFRNII